MVRTGLADPDSDQQRTTNERHGCLIVTLDIHWHLTLCSFQRTYSLLCRWQEQLEYFLYHFCRVAAPALAEKSHWPCPEAAELSQLSEKVIEYFCLHRKKLFQARDISECERETFCSDLHTIRQIRHCAVHRAPVNAATIAKYARSAQNVLAILQRLGGPEFQNVYGGQVCLVDIYLLSSILLTPYVVKVGALPSVILGCPKPPSATISSSPASSPRTEWWWDWKLFATSRRKGSKYSTYATATKCRNGKKTQQYREHGRGYWELTYPKSRSPGEVESANRGCTKKKIGASTAQPADARWSRPKKGGNGHDVEQE